ncbi:MAG: phosphoenolpyruvate carboxylase [Pseudomonadota bacterium]
MLGDTVREQEGEAVFALVEQVRQTSIRFRRDGDEAARRELEATLDSLPREAYPLGHPRLQLLRPSGQHR